MIKVDNLTFGYDRNPVLEGITLSLEEGKIYGLLGENGVGKSTLLTLLCGLKKPASGTIAVTSGEGYFLHPFDRDARFLQDIYFLPETLVPYNMTARRFAEYSGRFWPYFSMERFLEIMASFETDPDQKMNRMSSGQLKKSYISFALSLQTRYLLMDEPTNGLDIPSKSQFRKALLHYLPEESAAVIATHQVLDLENVIDPIIILDRKAVLLNASLEEISQRLFFDYGSTLRPYSLYSEQLPGGFIQVLPNDGLGDSLVNIEALFNAAHLHKDYIKELFSK